jgi:peptidoglycan/LPS O-acetylase OafA/YrhL
MAKREQHIGALDGLRAAAILLVLLYHLTPDHESSHGLRTLLFKIADLGWSGVDLFFVLSGFLITTKLLAARDDAHPFRDFYVRRTLRIFPLYYAVVFVVLVVIPAIAAVPYANASQQLSYWFYYANFRHDTLPTEHIAPIGHFWSLAIEEQFYLLWPLVILRAPRKLAVAICCALTVLPMPLRYFFATNGFHWTASYAWTPSRMEGLAIGALLAIAAERGFDRKAAIRASLVTLALSTPFLAFAAWRDRAMLVVKTLTTSEAIFARTVLPTAAAIAFGALLVLSLEWGALGRALSIGPLRRLARYSYGLYVFHVLLLPLTRLIARRWFASDLAPNTHALLFFVTGSTLSLGAAIASYHLYEMRFLRLKERLTGRREA